MKQANRIANDVTSGRMNVSFAGDRQPPARCRTTSRRFLMPSAALRVRLGRPPTRPLRQQRRDFLRAELAPAAERELAELDVHDAHAAERLDGEAERLAHAADLPVEALREDDREH